MGSNDSLPAKCVDATCPARRRLGYERLRRERIDDECGVAWRGAEDHSQNLYAGGSALKGHGGCSLSKCWQVQPQMGVRAMLRRSRVCRRASTRPRSLRPPQLYSHDDQTSLWHLGRTDLNFSRGWGGQIADLINECNTRQDISACISVAGSNRFQIGAEVFPYPVGTNGPVAMTGQTGTSQADLARRTALSAMLANTNGNPFQNEYAAIENQARLLYNDINAALSGNQVSTPFPVNNSLADQLRLVARLIKSRASLGQKRQIFFVQLSGYDTHDAQMGASGQPLLL